MAKKKNKRENIRSKVSVAARIVPEGGEPIAAQLVDLSLSGILVRSEGNVDVGQSCEIHLLIGHVDNELPIKASGTVVRVQEDRVAITFTALGIADKEEVKSMVLSHAENRAECLKELSKSALPIDPLSVENINALIL